MKEPASILETGTRVITRQQLDSKMSESLLVTCPSGAQHRRPMRIGEITGVVGGHGGDIYWVRHDDQTVGSYCWSEFNLRNSALHPTGCDISDLPGWFGYEADGSATSKGRRIDVAVSGQRWISDGWMAVAIKNGQAKGTNLLNAIDTIEMALEHGLVQADEGLVELAPDASGINTHGYVVRIRESVDMARYAAIARRLFGPVLWLVNPGSIYNPVVAMREDGARVAIIAPMQ